MFDLYGGTLAFDSVEHVYTFDRRDGHAPVLVPGCTSILKRLNKAALVQWAASTAANYVKSNWKPTMTAGEIDLLCRDASTAYRKVSAEAAGIGSTVHAYCEARLHGETPPTPLDEKARAGADAFDSWLSSMTLKPIALEHVVMSKAHWFAGTADYYGWINDELCVLDFKTSAGLYDEYLLQLAAYQIAIEEMHGEKIQARWLIRLDKKTGKFEAARFPHSDLHIDAFLAVRAIHRYLSAIEEKQEIKNELSKSKPAGRARRATARA